MKQEEENISEEGAKTEVTEILANLKDIREQGQMVERFIYNQISVKDDMINNLHKELDYYKQDATDRFINQLMKAIIKVRKDMVKTTQGEKWDTMSIDDLKREYVYILEDLTDLLEQQNVDCYYSEAGGKFDASIHKPKVEMTEDISLDKTIKKSVSEGYRKGNKILIPEQVVVYQYKQDEK